MKLFFRPTLSNKRPCSFLHPPKITSQSQPEFSSVDSLISHYRLRSINEIVQPALMLMFRSLDLQSEWLKNPACANAYDKASLYCKKYFIRIFLMAFLLILKNLCYANIKSSFTTTTWPCLNDHVTIHASFLFFSQFFSNCTDDEIILLLISESASFSMLTTAEDHHSKKSTEKNIWRASVQQLTSC